MSTVKTQVSSAKDKRFIRGDWKLEDILGVVYWLENAPIDKAAMIAVIERELRRKGIRNYIKPTAWSVFYPPAGVVQSQYKEKGILDLDIGLGKYWRNNYSSATEAVVTELGIKRDDALNALLDILRANNMGDTEMGLAGGFLKKGAFKRFPIAFATREAHKFRNADGEPLLSGAKIARQTIDAVHYWLDSFDKRGQKLYDSGRIPSNALLKVLDQVKGDKSGEFTVQQLVKNMFKCGARIDTILEAANYWIRITRRARNERNRDNKRLQALMPLQQFKFGTTNLTGMVLPSAYYDLANQAFGKLKPDLLIIVEPEFDGCAILCNRSGKVDLTPLAEHLNTTEKNRWHHETRFPGQILMNRNHQVKARKLTDLSVTDLIDLLQELVVS